MRHRYSVRSIERCNFSCTEANENEKLINIHENLAPLYSGRRIVTILKQQ
jgi:hypothetical protein